MLTVADWCQALLQERRVNVLSPPWLIEKVWPGNTLHAAQLNGRRPTPLWDDPYELRIQAVEILHAIGRMTSPTEPVNLLDLASTWAYYRYIWAFEPDLLVPDLQLSPYVAAIDSHQKTVMSDELGVGFAGVVMERLRGFGHPRDVLPLLASRSIPGMRAQGKRTPDYLCEAISDPGTFAVVECKGTQTPRHVYEQLRSGAEQVCGLEFRNPLPSGYVVATDLSTRPITVHIIYFPGAVSSEDEASGDTAVADELAATEDEASGDTAVADELAATWAVRLRQFLGNLANVAQSQHDRQFMQPNLLRAPIALGRLGGIEVDNMAFAVRRQTVFTIGQFEVTVTHGVAEPFVQLLQRDQLTIKEVQATVREVAQQRSNRRKQRAGLPQDQEEARSARETQETFVTPDDRADRFTPYNGEIPRDRERVRIAHIRDDGTLLEITIQPAST